MTKYTSRSTDGDLQDTVVMAKYTSRNTDGDLQEADAAWTEDTSDGCFQIKETSILTSDATPPSTHATAQAHTEEEDDFPYDKGWAWMICLGAFIKFMIYPSIMILISVLLTDLVTYFHTHVSVTALIPNLGGVVYSLSTQLWSTLFPRRYFRPLAIMAAVANASLSVAFVWAPSMEVFVVLFLGKCFVHGSQMVNILALQSSYFRHRRGLAVSLALTGVSVGQIMLPPVIRWCRGEYGIRGCFLLFAGWELQATVAAMLFRPKPTKRRSKTAPTMRHLEEGRPCDADTEHIPLQQTIIIAAPGATTDTHDNPCTVHNDTDVFNTSTKHSEIDMCKDEIKTPTIGLSNRDQLNNNNSHHDIPKRTNRTRTTSGMSFVKSMESIVRLTRCMKLARATIAILDKLFDFQLLRRPEAIVVVVAHAILVAGPFIQIYLVSHAESLGVSKTDSAYLLTAMGLALTVARLCYGQLADSKLLRVSQIIALPSLVMAAVCFTAHLMTSFPALMVLSVLTGGGGFVVMDMLPALIIETLGVQHLAKMMATNTLIACMVKAAQWPMVGALIEKNGNFDAIFYYAGGCFLLGAIVIGGDTLLARRRRSSGTRTM